MIHEKQVEIVIHRIFCSHNGPVFHSYSSLVDLFFLLHEQLYWWSSSYFGDGQNYFSRWEREWNDHNVLLFILFSCFLLYFHLPLSHLTLYACIFFFSMPGAAPGPPCGHLLFRVLATVARDGPAPRLLFSVRRQNGPRPWWGPSGKDRARRSYYF